MRTSRGDAAAPSRIVHGRARANASYGPGSRLRRGRRRGSIGGDKRYALAFADDPAAPRDAGLDALAAHVRALGAAPEGATALLAPVYGAAGLGEALCRACAVRGGVYALGVCPAGLVTAAGAFADAPRRVVGALFPSGRGFALVRCSRVVLGPDAVPRDAPHTRWVTRRISVIDGALGAADRSALAFEPDRQDLKAVRGFQMDDRVRAAPEGSGLRVLHLATHGGRPAR